MQRLETTARFKCPHCNGVATCKVAVPEPNWGASEKMSELTSEDQTEVICNLCKTEFAAYVQNSASGCAITLDEHPETKVSADYAFFSPSDPDEWINLAIPDDPHAVFMDTYHHLGDILAEYGIGGTGPLSHSGAIINRMVFSQLVSALEAFLGDTLLQRVLISEEALQKLLTQDTELKETRISLADIAQKPNIVTNTVQQHLQGILYHNLAKVAVLYKIALGQDIWPRDEIKAKLFKAIQYRHDCVHRNGRNKEGEELQAITTPYVQDMLESMRLLVDHIHSSPAADK